MPSYRAFCQKKADHLVMAFRAACRLETTLRRRMLGGDRDPATQPVFANRCRSCRHPHDGAVELLMPPAAACVRSPHRGLRPLRRWLLLSLTSQRPSLGCHWRRPRDRFRRRPTCAGPRFRATPQLERYCARIAFSAVRTAPTSQRPSLGCHWRGPRDPVSTSRHLCWATANRRRAVARQYRCASFTY